MKNTISFKILKEGKHYTASAVGFFIVTQGKTLDELSKNIREATELYFEDHKTKSKKNFNSISLNLPLYA
ncbi:MAG: type II toxin-antitoxin system HicB family antitoxin [Candidatus Zambryskibacteria bacterium]|nr:type II toxin-antitoxin system HicB family antitoxin [Candidatus Zambryskibacteria bacterium]